MRLKMSLGIATGTALLMMAACGGDKPEPRPEVKSEIAETVNPAEMPVETPSAAPVVTAPETSAKPDGVAFEDMNLPQGDFYCGLMREGHKFDFHDESSWQYVFVTELGGVPEKARVKYDGSIHEFERSTETLTETGVDWTFGQAEGKMAVELSLQAVEKGGEYTNYEGLMTLRNVDDGAALASLPVWGSCGV